MRTYFDYNLSCFENEKHQTQVSLLLELVSDAYLSPLQLVVVAVAPPPRIS